MIREPNVLDIPRINELGCLLEENFAKVYSINEMLEDKYSKIYVYEIDDVIVGFIIVDPEYRNRKIAMNLIDYLLSELDENLKLITLEVRANNTAAIHLYDKFGFEVVNVRKKYYSNGDDAYLMARESE